MKVPLLDLKRQCSFLSEEIEKVISDVVKSAYFIGGPKVKQIESEISKYVGSKHGIGVSSGTDAILLSLMAMGVKSGDEVITTNYSFFATAGAISRLGATPVFVDIELDTYNIDPYQIEEKITKNTKAIIVVHLYGQCADMDPIMEIANKHKLFVIEDAAQAIGSEYKNGIRAGTIGDVGCFSFFPSKNLGAIGDGGMVVTNNDDLADRLSLLKNHGAKPKYHHELIGGNFRLDAVQAAVLSVKLPYLDEWTKKRQDNAKTYRDMFIEKGVQIELPLEKWNRHIYNQFIIKISNRNELMSYLQNLEIGCEIYYPVPFHKQKCFSYLRNKEEFKNSDIASEQTLAIPIYPELKIEEQKIIVDAIVNFKERDSV
jgi:dTDP-4-amino-4,6-dideoxygalactose transaminase